MKQVFKSLVGFTLVLSVLSLFAQAQEPIFTLSSDVVWGECPPSLPAGCQFVVIAGDPSEGPFVFRLKVPSG